MPTSALLPSVATIHAGNIARATATSPADAERAFDAIRIATTGLPTRSVGSKTGPALKSKALRSNRVTA